MKKYITFGTKTLQKELFKPIINTGNNKPHGGLWLTEHTDVNANEWLLYLENEDLFLWKFNKQASIITLNDNINILNINNQEDYNNIRNNYCTDDGNIDYVTLSTLYDGINFKYIDEETKNWAVSTLLLFNLECIKEYEPAIVGYDQVEVYIKEYYLEKLESPRSIAPINSQFENIVNQLLETFLKDTSINSENVVEYTNRYVDNLLLTNFELINCINNIDLNTDLVASKIKHLFLHEYTLRQNKRKR